MTKQEKETLHKLIGTNIQRYLTEVKGMKQVHLAQQLGITKPTLSNILSGKRNISLHLLIEISQKLQIDPKELLPPLSEINSALFEKKKNIEKILENEGISFDDKKTILEILKTPKND